MVFSGWLYAQIDFDKANLCTHFNSRSLKWMKRSGRPLKAVNPFESRRLAFALALRDARRAADMSQSELAAHAGKSRDFIGRVERGDVLPDEEFVRRLTNVFPKSKSLVDAYRSSMESPKSTLPAATGSAQVFDIVGIGASNFDFIASNSALSKASGDPIIELGHQFEWSEEQFVDAETFERVLKRLDPNALEVRLGGSAFNTMNALGRMQLDLTLGYVSLLAKSSLADVSHQDELDQLGIDISMCAESPNLPGRCISYVEDGARHLLTNPWTDEEMAAFFQSRFHDILDYLKRARIVHVSSFPRGKTEEVVFELLSRLKRESPLSVITIDPGCPWAVEMSPAIAGILELADFVMVNYRELKALAQAQPGQSADEIMKTALEQCGPNGAIVLVERYDSVRMMRKHGPQVHRIGVDGDMGRIEDATGAGDVFDAGLLASLVSRRLRCELGVRVGVEMARASVASIGAVSQSDLAETSRRAFLHMKELINRP